MRLNPLEYEFIWFYKLRDTSNLSVVIDNMSDPIKQQCSVNKA